VLTGKVHSNATSCWFIFETYTEWLEAIQENQEVDTINVKTVQCSCKTKWLWYHYGHKKSNFNHSYENRDFRQKWASEKVWSPNNLT